MDKGAGIAMCCTFGDLTDVTWWRELDLPVRTVIGRDGRLPRETPEWLADEPAAAAYDELKGKTTFSAREAMVAALRETGDLDGEPTPTQRMTNFYEKGDKPLEIVATRQWYIRNGGRDAALRAEMLERGAEIEWIPAHMKHRYDNWVGGLNGDWLISRQRFFGIPFPVWYPLDDDGEPDYDHPLLPREAELPIDPSTDAPSGYTEDQRGKPGGFIGDPDVMDTWATSSLTPQIAGGWESDDDLWQRVFPMDLCTQAHDIIRTWLFSRVVRAHFENHVAPWSHALISGFILDPDRKKMSKSKGNVVVPTDILEKFGADAVRWRAAMARPGPGLAVRRDPDEGRPPAGDEGPQRLEVRPRRRRRHLRSTRFEVSEPVDCALLGRLADVVTARPPRRSRPTTTRPRSRSAEKFFWEFCDDYLELVKERAYDEDGRSGDRLGPGHAGDRPRRSSSGCSRRSCPTSPRRSGRGGRRARSTAPPGRPRPTSARPPPPTPSIVDAVAAALIGHPGRQVAGQGLDARRADPGRDHAAPRRWSGPPSSPPTTCARPARSPASWCSPSTSRRRELTVDAELAAAPRGLSTGACLERGWIRRISGDPCASAPKCRPEVHGRGAEVRPRDDTQISLVHDPVHDVSWASAICCTLSRMMVRREPARSAALAGLFFARTCLPSGLSDRAIARLVASGHLRRVRHGADVAAESWEACAEVGRHGLVARVGASAGSSRRGALARQRVG